MSVDSRQLEEQFEAVQDPGFRSRAILEYRRVKSWVGNRIDLDKAKILDFGCGRGIAAASFAMRHPSATVLGLDIERVAEGTLRADVRTHLNCDLPSNVTFGIAAPKTLYGLKGCDLIYAWSVFEHVREDVLADLFEALKKCLAPNGVLFVQINPLYFSPRGSNLYNYFKSPWHHLILSLDMLREGVLSEEPTASEQREWRQFLALNRLTAQDIVGRATSAGLHLIKEQRFTTDLSPPPRLSRTYDKEALTTTELIALFQ